MTCPPALGSPATNLATSVANLARNPVANLARDWESDIERTGIYHAAGPRSGDLGYPGADAPTSGDLDDTNRSPAANNEKIRSPEQEKVREVFNDFVGQTFYGHMLSAMRKTVDKPAYLHGGRGEEVFQAQLDQTLSEQLADATANQFTGPMFELFELQRR